MFLPILILITRKGRMPFPAFIAGALVVVGSWFKRYLIVTPTLLHPFLPMHDVPETYKHYFPSWEEWAIAMGSLAGMLLVVTVFARLFPIIPIQETITEIEEHEKV
jgi:molybdopterin-containing oxidoreductase family membrane subunit